MRSRSGDRRPARGCGGARGAVRPGCLLALLLAAIAVYAGIKLLASEMRYRSIQETASREARFAETKTDEEIHQAVLDEVIDLELPPAAHRVRVRRLSGGRVHVSLAYPDTVRFLGRWEWVRPRRISVQGPP